MICSTLCRTAVGPWEAMARSAVFSQDMSNSASARIAQIRTDPSYVSHVMTGLSSGGGRVWMSKRETTLGASRYHQAGVRRRVFKVLWTRVGATKELWTDNGGFFCHR